MEHIHEITVPSHDQSGRVTIEHGTAMIRSWKSFVDYFGDARTIRAVTYSHSPQIVHQVFNNEALDVDHLEVIVGDHRQSDFREKLQGDTELASKLNYLLQTEQLHLYTLDKRVTLHSKLYIAENRDGTRTLLLGSPNLSKEAWSSNQTNTVSIYLTEGDSVYDADIERLYGAHREQCEVFMEDLTERLDAADGPEEKTEELNLWIGGTAPSDNPMGEFNREIVDAIEGAEEVTVKNVVEDAEEADQVITRAAAGGGDIDPTEVSTGNQLRLSPHGLEEPLEDAKPNLTRHNVMVNASEIRGSPAGFDRFLRSFNDGFPTMWIDRDDMAMRMQVDNTGVELTAEPDEPAAVNAALEHIESYIETVERFGDAKHPRETMAHFYEALLYVFWSPFADHFAREYAALHGAELDKDLPFLYIHGQNDSGKGMFLRFATRLISNGLVAEPVEGQQFDKEAIRRCRAGGTVYPFVVDDVDKQDVEKDILKTYWQGAWDGTIGFPTFIFTSNDGNPKSEYRTRMKMLEFDVVFDVEGHEREETARIIDEPNRLFAWFSYLMFRKDVSLPDREDKLVVARQVFNELYDIAGREKPKYFPRNKPAEVRYDHGRRKWQEAHESGLFTIEERNGVLFADFSRRLEENLVWNYIKLVPSTIRADKQSTRIKFDQPERFYEWTEIAPTKRLLLSRFVPGR